MALQTLTLHLPDTIYERLKNLAKKADRPLAEETLALIQSALDEENAEGINIIDQLDQLKHLTDAELWQAAKSTAADEDTETMQVLLERQQREGLTSHEEEQAKVLSSHFNKIMLVRAKAAALLAQRGHDISNLSMTE